MGLLQELEVVPPSLEISSQPPPRRTDLISHARNEFIKLMQLHGYVLVRRWGRSSALMQFKRPDGRVVGVKTLVAIRLKSTGQCGFSSTANIPPDISWMAFISVPWSKTYLRRVEEIEKLSKSYTFSRGASDVWSLDNRVAELKED
jgi:hypothetical protein